MALLADILRPSLRQEDFDTEKQVILEEIQMYEDQPPFGADDKCRAACLRRHPLGRSVLGTAASIGGLAGRRHAGLLPAPLQPGQHRAGRRPAGSTSTRLVAAARRYCGALGAAARRGRLVAPAQPQPGLLTLIHKASATQQYAVQLAAGPAADDRDRYAAKLLATVLGDDSGSRLYWELVDPGLAEQAS